MAQEPERPRRSVADRRAEVEAFWAFFQDEEKAQEELHQRVVDHFKYGVRKLCARAIWKRIEELVGVPSQEALAARFDLSPAVVSRGLSEGALSLENLIVMLTELQREFAIFDPILPNRKALSVAGYQEAMSHIRSREGAEGVDRKPTPEEFCCLRSLYAHPLWFEADAATLREEPGGEAEEQLLAATRRVRQAADGLFGGPVTLTEPPDFRHLRTEWGDAYWTCFVAVAYQWLDDVHGS